MMMQIVTPMPMPISTIVFRVALIGASAAVTLVSSASATCAPATVSRRADTRDLLMIFIAISWSAVDYVPTGTGSGLDWKGSDECVNVLRLGRAQVEALRAEPTDSWTKTAQALELGGTDQRRGVAVAAGDGDDLTVRDLLEVSSQVGSDGGDGNYSGEVSEDRPRLQVDPPLRALGYALGAADEAG